MASNTSNREQALTHPLRPQDGPMVWIDCEMTGLNHRSDNVLEIAVVITDGSLNPVDKGVSYAIKTDQKVLSSMGDWCLNQHGKSGLIDACLASQHTKEHVEDAVLNYIKRWVPVQKSAVLCGNSVHADRYFLAEEMPRIIDYLHYRIVDVSSIKELVKRWYPSQSLTQGTHTSKHRAMDDILDSIKELKHYKDTFFIPEAMSSNPSPPTDAPIASA